MSPCVPAENTEIDLSLDCFTEEKKKSEVQVVVSFISSRLYFY